MRIALDQSLQLFDRCLHKLANGDLPIAELPDSIYVLQEIIYEFQDDSGIAIKDSIRHFVEKMFPDINANLNATVNRWIFG